ncbi:adenylate/guanylate cyclase domain-containing protein [Pseudomonadota bacterium]
MNERLPRKLAAILYADVAGYSRLTGADEDGTHRRLRSCLSTADDCVKRYGGRVCHYAGDALLVDFPSAVSALDCAVYMQEKFQQCNIDEPDTNDMAFRIGLNLGEVIIDDNEIYGDSVNIAARLESIAEPGGICVSRKIWDEVNGKVDYQFEDKGQISVKNISEPVNAYWVVMAGSEKKAAIDQIDAEPTPSVAKPSIAILPLTNMSGDSEQEYFVDGLTEDIITGLSRFRSINVIARNSTFTYKGKAVKIQDVGKELGAEYVVEGSVRRAGNQIRITVQLIDARDGSHVWAQKYDRMLDDIFAVQDEVTQSILTALPERVEAADLEKGKRKSTAQMAAYDYFLRGRELHHKFTEEDCREGITCLRKAVGLDPAFAQAWAWLGCIVGQAWIRGYLPNPKSLWRECVDASRKALELDDEDSECHRLMSEIYLIQHKFEQAEHHNQRGLSLNPNNPRLVVQRGYLLAYTGRPDEGIEWIKKVIQLDPAHPEAYYANLAIAFHAAGQYEDSILIFKRVPRLQSKHYAYLVSSHNRLSQESAALENAKMLQELDPGFSISRFGRTLQYKNPEEIEHFLADLHKVNLPD